MIRKVNFPIKYKFVLVITLLLLLTMGFYLSYALNIFKEDKAADVYSITLTNSISVAERTKLLINEETFLLEGLKDLSGEALKNKMLSLVDSREEILALECLPKNGDYQSVVNNKRSDLAGTGSVEAMNLGENNGALRLLRQTPEGSTRVEPGLIKNFPPHFTVVRSLSPELKCAQHIAFLKLMPLMNETLNYGTYLITSTGKIFFKLNNVELKKNLTDIVNDPAIMNIQQGVKRFNESGGAMIRAFSKVQGLGLVAITEIPEKRAFLASEQLISKSVYFGILILSVAVIAGILFTKRMTKNVQTLFDATTQLSEGNFDVHPVALGNDEIGALTDSFIDMKDKILKFMEEMKEKARLEGEMQVAHLVQHSFFPKGAVVKNLFNFDGIYRPASECSGDWWGYFEQGPLTTLIVCDATGHGVPAALITAAAHSCVSTLKMESEKSYISPSMVLARLNKVIGLMNTEILMTAFALEIDESKNVVTYSNASHMTPYLLRKVDGEYTKEGVIPLQENNGPRLGQNMTSTYEESKLDLFRGDQIIMFSDGITEMAVDGRAWGQRNFLKSIFKGCVLDSTGLIETVINDFRQFTKEAPLQDDVTLICVNYAPKVEQLTSSAVLKNGPMVISTFSNEENIKELLIKDQINHLIGHNTLDLERETKLVQILESRADFSINDYINDTYKKRTWGLFSNKKITDVVNEMAEEFQAEFKGPINLDVLRLVSEELLSNSFYHSGGAGVHYARGQEIVLTPDKEVEYLFAVNDEYVIISVKGPSAFASREKVIESIHRGYVEKTPLGGENGAGLGLYMIYENCNQFWVINGMSGPGQIICVFEKFNRYKQAKERITSFHYLLKEIKV